MMEKNPEPSEKEEEEEEGGRREKARRKTEGEENGPNPLGMEGQWYGDSSSDEIMWGARRFMVVYQSNTHVL